MSATQPKCSECGGECELEGLHPFPPPGQHTYGVAWRCKPCDKRSLLVSNLGPLIPSKELCLNCGQALELEGCPGCGLSESDARSFLGLDDAPSEDAVQRAQSAFHQGLFSHGVALLNQVLQHDQNNARAWELKSNFLAALEFWEACEQMLSGALEHGAPSSLRALYAELLERRGDPIAAAKVYQTLAETPGASDEPGVWYAEQGRVLVAAKDFEGAEHAYTQAMTAMPEHPLLYLNFADLFMQQQQWNQALPLLIAGLEHATNPEEQIALLEAKGHAHAGAIEGLEALVCIDAAIALGTDSVKAHYTRGRALAMIGRLAEARDAMAEVLKQQPDMPQAQKALTQIDAMLTT